MTGLIYVVIIALWVAVLVPMWLKRHDQVSEVRSTTRFHNAMQSLGGQRELAYETSYGSAPASRTPSRTAYDTRRPRLAERDMARTPYRELNATQRAMAVRRGIVLGALTGVLALTLLLAFASVLPKWLPIIFAIPVAGFIVATAMTASERAESATRDSARTRRAPRDLRREMDDAIAATAPKSSLSDAEWENWSAWDDEDAWEAVPTTLPTYVSAPRASAIPRPIDKSRPGEWTGEAMVEAAQSMRRHQVTFDEVDARANTAEIPIVTAAPQRRAANE